MIQICIRVPIAQLPKPESEVGGSKEEDWAQTTLKWVNTIKMCF